MEAALDYCLGILLTKIRWLATAEVQRPVLEINRYVPKFGITMVYGTPLCICDIYMHNLIIYTTYFASRV